MNESEFIDKIDCNFPYDDRQKASSIIDQACQLSPNAAFMIAHELARPPRGVSDKVDKTVLLDILSELEGKCEHPLKPMVFPICRKMIRGQKVGRKEVLAVLDRLKDYPGQYCAAAIVYFSCDDETSLNEIEERYHALMKAWKGKGA